MYGGAHTLRYTPAASSGYLLTEILSLQFINDFYGKTPSLLIKKPVKYPCSFAIFAKFRSAVFLKNERRKRIEAGVSKSARLRKPAPRLRRGDVVKLVYTLVLGTSAERRVGSSPIIPTNH
jgi:hypothetical protein